jgi:predicted esterase
MDPHAGQPVVTAGARIEQAHAAVLMLHGRGASPGDILGLVPALARPGVAFLAPAAAGGSWYPYSFMKPISMNEPGLSSALRVVDGLVAQLTAGRLSRDRLVLLGFSQGACLAGEFAVRHADRYGGVVLLSGGLIGPPGQTWDNPGDLGGTPVFLGCSDVDPHIPLARVEESAAVFSRMGARVVQRIYPGMGHLVVEDELVEAQAIIDAVARPLA